MQQLHNEAGSAQHKHRFHTEKLKFWKDWHFVETIAYKVLRQYNLGKDDRFYRIEQDFQQETLCF